MRVCMRTLLLMQALAPRLHYAIPMEDHPPTEVYHAPIPDAVDILVHRLLYHFDSPFIADDEPMGFFGVNQSGWLPPDLIKDELSTSTDTEEKQ